jgi:hypothetical protein
MGLLHLCTKKLKSRQWFSKVLGTVLLVFLNISTNSCLHVELHNYTSIIFSIQNKSMHILYIYYRYHNSDLHTNNNKWHIQYYHQPGFYRHGMCRHMIASGGYKGPHILSEIYLVAMAFYLLLYSLCTYSITHLLYYPW